MRVLRWCWPQSSRAAVEPVPRTSPGRSASTACMAPPPRTGAAGRAARDARARSVRDRRRARAARPVAPPRPLCPSVTARRRCRASRAGRRPGCPSSGAAASRSRLRGHRRRQHLLPDAHGTVGALRAGGAGGEAGRPGGAARAGAKAVRDHAEPAGCRRHHRRRPEGPGRRDLPPGRSRGRRAPRGHHGLGRHAREAIGAARAPPAAHSAKEAVKPLPLVPLLCSALLLASPPQPLRAAGAAAQQPPTIRINYVNADLGDVIRSLAVVLGVNVVLTNVPNRRITFQTPEPVPAAQVGGVLEAILESQGLVLVQTGPVAQVLPEERRPTTGPVRVGKELSTPPPLGLVTQIVPLEYMRADEAVALLKEVASKAARIEVVPRSNAVLITDRGVSVARYLDLLRQLDVKTGGESGLRTYVYPLKHASAAELATTLGQVFGATVSAAPERQE